MSNRYYIFIKNEISYLLKKISGNYLIKEVNGTKIEYENLFLEYLNKTNNLKNFISENFSIDEINFINQIGKLTQIVKKNTPLNYNHGFIIHHYLTKYLDEKKCNNINILETGTARGFSSIIMSRVLINKKVSKGSIYTLDILPHNIKMYWNCISDPINGKVTRKELIKEYVEYSKNINFIEGFSYKTLKKLNLDRINFAFLDGAHDYFNVKFEYEYVKERQKPGDIIIFDDVTPHLFDGIVKLIDQIKKSGEYNVQIINSDLSRNYALITKI